MNIEHYAQDMGFVAGCDECWGAQAPCDEHTDDFEV